jgi:phosphate transport system substrate-binding protein
MQEMGKDRMNDVQSIAARIGLVLLLGSVVGCGGGGGGAAGLTPAAAIVVDGSSTVVRISEAAQKAFKAVNPGITVTVDEHGTGGGFARYLQNEVDIVDASRTATAKEEAKAKEQGIDWTRFYVGYDGITLVVNAKNDFVKELSVDQLKAIWAPDSKVKTWKDVDPSWPARPIVLYSPDNDSGTFEFFTDAIVGKAKSQRDDVQQNSSDNSLVQGVAGDADGLGYFGYAYYASNTDKLRAVAVKNGKDAKSVLPSPETIKDKTYAPLSRPLFIYVKNSAAKRAEVAQFLRFYVENVDRFAVEGGYDAPVPEEKSANQEALSRLLGGETKAKTDAK